MKVTLEVDADTVIDTLAVMDSLLRNKSLTDPDRDYVEELSNIWRQIVILHIDKTTLLRRVSKSIGQQRKQNRGEDETHL